MMKFDIEQFSAINAAVANVARAYNDKHVVPRGVLGKYAKAAGVRAMDVVDRDGKRMVLINNGLIEIIVGATPAPVQPNSPTSGSGDVVEFEEPLRKVA